MLEPRPFPICPHYRVYADGRLESCLAVGRKGGPTDRWRPIKTFPNKKGYRRVTLRIVGREMCFSLHEMVLMTFVGFRPEGMVCRHLDGNPSNNHIDNLAWGTPEENMADKWRHGTMPAKLTPEDRDHIRFERRVLGKTFKELAAEYGVSTALISYVINGRPASHNRPRREVASESS